METNTQTQTYDLVRIINESGLEKSKSDVLIENFSNYFEIAKEWDNKAKQIVVTSKDQVEDMKTAREGRLMLQKKRTAVEHTRKQLKENSLREGKAIDNIAKILTGLIEPIETYLEDQEKFIERQEAKERQIKREARELETRDYSEFIPYGLDFGNMTDEDYALILNGAKLQAKAKVDAIMEEENKRIQEERLNTIEQQRKIEIAPYLQFVSTSNDLRNMKDEDFSSLLASLQEAKKQYDIEQNKIRIENERLKAEAEAKEKELAKERAKLESERLANEEKAKKEKEIADAKLKAEKEANNKKQADLQAKLDEQERLRKLEEKRIADEKKATLEAEKKAKKAPDKIKLSELVKTIESIQMPELKSEEGQKIIEDIKGLLTKVVNYANGKISEL